MEQELKSHLRRCAEAYAAAAGVPLSTVADRCMSDSRFFDRIDGGKTFTVKTYDKVMAFFAGGWPENAVWPDGVPRPDAPQQVAAE